MDYNSIESEKSLSENDIFENKEEELEYYKKNFNELKKNILQYETRIKILENSNKKLQKSMNENKRGGNNTSVQFFLPSEFKKLWENLTETELLAPFDNFIDNYIFISHICQDLTNLTYFETKNIIDKKFNSLLFCLDIKINSDEEKKLIFSKFIPLFQEHFFDIFKLKNENIDNIKNKLINISNLYTFNFDKNDLKESINDKQFNILLKSLFDLCLHMLLHDPLLTFNILPYEKRTINYYYYNKKEFQSIEGFGNEKTPCLIILPPPLLKNSFPFNGMKYAVYLIENPSLDIIQKCDKFKKENDLILQNNLEEKKSKNDNKKNYNNIIELKNEKTNEIKNVENYQFNINLLLNNNEKKIKDKMINFSNNNEKESNEINNLKDIKEIKFKTQKKLEKKEEEKNQKIKSPSINKVYQLNILKENLTPNNRKIEPTYNNYIKNTPNLLNSDRMNKNNINEKPHLFSYEENKKKQNLTPNYRKENINYKKNNVENKNDASYLYYKYLNQDNEGRNNFNFEKSKNNKRRISNNSNSIIDSKSVNNYQKEKIDYLNELYKKYSDFSLNYDNINYYSNYKLNNYDNYITSAREIYLKGIVNENLKNNFNTFNLNNNNTNTNINTNSNINNYNLNSFGIDYLKKKYNIYSGNQTLNKIQSYSFNY